MQYQPIQFGQFGGFQNDLVCVACCWINREAPRFVMQTVFAAFASCRWKERIAVSHWNLSDFCHGTDLLCARKRIRRELDAVTSTLIEMLTAFLPE